MYYKKYSITFHPKMLYCYEEVFLRVLAVSGHVMAFLTHGTEGTEYEVGGLYRLKVCIGTVLR